MSSTVVFRGIPGNWSALALNGGICLLKQREGDTIDTIIHTKSYVARSEDDIEQWVEEISKEISQDSSIVMENEPKIIGSYGFSVMSSMCYHPAAGDIIKTGYYSVIETETSMDFIVIYTTVLMDNAFDDDPEIMNILNNIVIGVAT